MSDDGAPSQPCCLAAEGKPCYSGHLCNFCFILPLGGLVGLFISYLGYFTFIGPHFSDVDKAVSAMGVDMSTITGLVASGSVFVLGGNLLIVCYGFREKTRTRLNHCAHLNGGMSTTIKFVFKGVLHSIVLASVGICIALFVLFEAMWVLFIVVKSFCDGASLDAIEPVLEIMGGGSSDTTTICDNVGEGASSAWSCAIGFSTLIVSQTIMFCYWMKYSTLANIAAYWTTGDYAEDTPDVDKDYQDDAKY